MKTSFKIVLTINKFTTDKNLILAAHFFCGMDREELKKYIHREEEREKERERERERGRERERERETDRVPFSRRRRCC